MIFFFFLSIFSLIDILLNSINIEGRYYIIHSITNLMVTCRTYHSLYDIFTNNIVINKTDIPLAEMVSAMHIYHIILYFNKLRFDDWLHHLLMVFVALPLTVLSNCETLMHGGLFFLTGLPGLLDYSMLALVRNNIIHRMTEKKYNTLINLWIRAPGCILVSGFILFNVINLRKGLYRIDPSSGVLVGALVYWNGIYFMNQVVQDYAILTQ